MFCPICNEEMTQWKEELARNKKRATGATYLRRRYRCEKDDTWGRIEVPVGTIQSADQHRAPVAAR